MKPTGLAKRVVEDYDLWRDYTTGHRKRWENYWKQYNNQRVKPGYRSKAKVAASPMVHQIVETRNDNIFGSRPKWSYVPTMPEQETDTKILVGMAEYSWDKANMDLHVMAVGREQEIAGNTIVFNGWEDGCMTYNHVPLADCIGDVNAANPYEVTKIGYRRLALLEDLEKEQRFDPTAGEKESDGNPKGEWVLRYKNLGKIKTWTSMQGEPTAKKLAEDIYAGSSLSDTGTDRDKQVEVIFMMYLDKFVEVANRQVVINEYDNPFQAPERQVEVQLQNDEGEKMYADDVPPELVNKAQQGVMPTDQEIAGAAKPLPMTITAPAIKPFLPFAMGRGFVNPAVLLAKGTVETISELYEDLNDQVSIKKDNLISRQQNNAFVDTNQFADIVPKLAKAAANDFIPADGIADGKDPVRWIEKPELANDADVEINRLKQEIRDTARVDQVVQGVASQNDRTATEIDAQVAGASAGFKTQTKTVGAGLFKMFGENFYKMVQIFVTKEQLVRVIGPQGVEFKKFNPDKYFGPYDVKVTLASEAEAAKNKEAQEAMAFGNYVKMSPYWNQIEVEKYVAEKTTDIPEDRLKLMMNPNPMNQAMMGGAPAGDVAPGTPMAPPGPPGVPA